MDISKLISLCKEKNIKFRITNKDTINGFVVFTFYKTITVAGIRSTYVKDCKLNIAEETSEAYLDSLINNSIKELLNSIGRRMSNAIIENGTTFYDESLYSIGKK